MRWVFLAALIVGLAAASETAVAQTTSSPAAIIDGDTLEVNGETIRLYGIDAPELGQLCRKGANQYRCGYDAALTLRNLVGNAPISCRATPVDASDPGQICSVGLVDLAEAMLRRGYAVALPNAITFYRRAEYEAQRSKLGIWRGDFVPPSEWREGRRLQARNGDPSQICDVKGIVSDKGIRVYLVTSDPDYETVEIDQSRGERLFCSDDEAELAGWRRWPKTAVRQRTSAGSNQSN